MISEHNPHSIRLQRPTEAYISTAGLVCIKQTQSPQGDDDLTDVDVLVVLQPAMVPVFIGWLQALLAELNAKTEA